MDSGETDTLDEYICNDDFIRERGITLARVLNWQIYWDDVNETVNLEPEGTTSYANNLTVGSNVSNLPKWKKDISPMINFFKIKGATRRDWKEETFDGDASTATFTLAETPKDTEVFVDSGAGEVLQVRGVTNSTETFDYEVNEEQNSITFQSSSIPPSDTGNIRVRYSADVPIPVIVRNQSSIDSFRQQDGQREFEDIRNINDAIARGRNIINRLGTPFTSTTLQTIGEFGLKVGMKVRVIDVQQDRDLELTVQRITYQYPEGFDIVEVGDKDFKLRDLISNINTRVRELEKKAISNSQIINQVFDFVRTYTMKRRYFKKQTQDVSMDGAWDVGFGDGISQNTLAWDAGGAIWQENFTNSPVDSVIIPGNMTYEELFYDEEFNDSGNATWDASNERIDFTSGQNRVLGPFLLGVTPTAYTITTGTITGSLLVEVSADGKNNWETVSTGIRTSFALADATGVYIRLTENAASTARIESTYDDAGRLSQAGVRCILEE